jgi:hypothetical protein
MMESRRPTSSPTLIFVNTPTLDRVLCVLNQRLFLFQVLRWQSA